MTNAIKLVFRFGPIIFAFGFLAPLAAQIIHASGRAPPFGLSPLAAGLIIGGTLGIVAQIRGRWV